MEHRLIMMIDPEGKHVWVCGVDLPFHDCDSFSQYNLKAKQNSEALIVGNAQIELENGKNTHVFWIRCEDSIIQFKSASIQRVKKHLLPFVACQEAKVFTERALKKQGKLHKDIIPLIGYYIWASREKEDWKKN